MTNFRKCYEPHLRDYPDCLEECGFDTCQSPISLSVKFGKFVKCGNCGMYRMIRVDYTVGKCPMCGDDEYEVRGI